MTCYLQDHAFAHHSLSVSQGTAQSGGHQPLVLWRWKRPPVQNVHEPLVVTDVDLGAYLEACLTPGVDARRVHWMSWGYTDVRVRVIAWLIEPISQQPHVYALLGRVLRTMTMHAHKIERIWCHDNQWLHDTSSSFPHCTPAIHWVPNAMTSLLTSQRHVVDTVARMERCGRPGARLCTALFSDKRGLPAYTLRHQLYGDSPLHQWIDFQGSITGTRFDSTYAVLSSYLFVVVVENQQRAGYFSEKLIDGLLLGLIPLVYRGHENPLFLHHYFDTRGWFFFDDVGELMKQVSTQCTVQHFRRHSSVRHRNAERAFYHYTSVESWLMQHPEVTGCHPLACTL
jgi:hypothetical protein